MENAAKKFVPRSPRYVLRPGENHFLRYAFEGDKDHSYTTRFVNISETGLAFLVDRNSTPILGEQIMIEFTLPTGEKIAWFAKVRRLEAVSHTMKFQYSLEADDHIVVGVHFEELPHGHLKSVRAAINEKFLDMLREQRKNSIKHFVTFLAYQYGRVGLYLVLGLLTFTMLYFLSQPGGNYEKDMGARWGDRYK